MQSAPSLKSQPKGPDPILAAVLSAVPGCGQIYNGDTRKGILFLLVTLVSAVPLSLCIFNRSLDDFAIAMMTSLHLRMNERILSSLHDLGVSSPQFFILLGLFAAFAVFAMLDAYKRADSYRRALYVPSLHMETCEAASGSFIAHSTLIATVFVFCIAFWIPPRNFVQTVDIEFEQNGTTSRDLSSSASDSKLPIPLPSSNSKHPLPIPLPASALAAAASAPAATQPRRLKSLKVQSSSTATSPSNLPTISPTASGQSIARTRASIPAVLTPTPSPARSLHSSPATNTTAVHSSPMITVAPAVHSSPMLRAASVVPSSPMINAEPADHSAPTMSSVTIDGPSDTTAKPSLPQPPDDLLRSSPMAVPPEPTVTNGSADGGPIPIAVHPSAAATISMTAVNAAGTTDSTAADIEPARPAPVVSRIATAGVYISHLRGGTQGYAMMPDGFHSVRIRSRPHSITGGGTAGPGGPAPMISHRIDFVPGEAPVVASAVVRPGRAIASLRPLDGTSSAGSAFSKAINSEEKVRNDYMEDVRRRVVEKWIPQGLRRGSLDVAFQIHGDGTISNLSLLRSSRRSKADAAALAAVETAAPFGVVSFAHTGDISVVMTLDASMADDPPAPTGSTWPPLSSVFKKFSDASSDSGLSSGFTSAPAAGISTSADHQPQFHRVIAPTSHTSISLGTSDGRKILIDAAHEGGSIVVRGSGGGMLIEPGSEEDAAIIRTTTMPGDILIGPHETATIVTQSGPDWGLVTVRQRTAEPGSIGSGEPRHRAGTMIVGGSHLHGTAAAGSAILISGPDSPKTIPPAHYTIIRNGETLDYAAPVGLPIRY